jgi:hypothetical protein
MARLMSRYGIFLVQYDDSQTGSGEVQLVGSRQTHDACADDGYVVHTGA